jgi:protein tyrosine/serine phosphatase
MDAVERTLAWEGCMNVRDLGGHPTADGGTTGFGRIVRADSVRQLTHAGWEALVEYGVGTIVDLRFHDELEADPPGDIPVDVVHIPLLGEIDPEYGTELDQLAEAAGTDAEATQSVYLDFLERYPKNFATVIRAVADAPEGAVLVHCMGGKDRTGLVVALLLSLAGVPADEVAADYAVSERNLAEWSGRWIDSAPDDAERARRRRISACPPDAMRGVLEELARRHGSVRGYLQAAGSSEDELERAAARLRS